ncbi:MAG: RsfS/YbeB/iojap family protein [Chloroflexi bacterium]|nr:RsfS/YbeB/iojap family protein [Chloroflexota bacterium]
MRSNSHTNSDRRRLSGKVAIVGADESDEIGIVPSKSSLQLHAEAARNALADAGIDMSDVDGLFTAGPGWSHSLQVAEYLGIQPRYTDSTSVGGSSFVIHVEHAAAAIQAGLINVALITHGQSGHSDRRRPGTGRPSLDPWFPAPQFESPYHVGGPPSVYAMACMRHMHQYGTTHEQLAEIAVATRKWAMLNPKAMMRDPLTIDDVLSSRWITYPFHLLDCCLVTDAGGAVVVTSAERAKDCPKKPVLVLGSGEATTHQTIASMPDLTTTPAAISGPLAFEMAGVRHKAIDVTVLDLRPVSDAIDFFVIASGSSDIHVRALAEYVPADARLIARKPASLTFVSPIGKCCKLLTALRCFNPSSPIPQRYKLSHWSLRSPRR